MSTDPNKERDNITLLDKDGRPWTVTWPRYRLSNWPGAGIALWWPTDYPNLQGPYTEEQAVPHGPFHVALKGPVFP